MDAIEISQELRRVRKKEKHLAELLVCVSGIAQCISDSDKQWRHKLVSNLMVGAFSSREPKSIEFENILVNFN